MNPERVLHRILLTVSLALLGAAAARAEPAVPQRPRSAHPTQRAHPVPLTLTRLAGEPVCPNNGSIVTAYVVAINQSLTLNRLGAQLPDGLMFALARDVFPNSVTKEKESEQNSCRALWNSGQKCQAGNVHLRSAKRPRPLALRVNEGQCLQVVFGNLLSPDANSAVTSDASVHVQGVQWVKDSQDDGSWVGNNPTSLVKSGGTHTYTLYAAHEGSFLLYSTADTFTNANNASDGGQLALGLFGAVTIQPAGAEWYRSEVTEQDLCRASHDGQVSQGTCLRKDPSDLPVVNYRAVYKDTAQAGVPVLNLLNCPNQATAGCPHGGELVHGDLTALITGRTKDGKPGSFPASGLVRPVFNPAYALPDRLQPWREFVILYHEMFSATQAFPNVYSQVLKSDGNGADFFGFNYGMGGIGSEILANRFGVGPEAGCTSCKYEEFFLASWAVGDPAMVVDKPAYSDTNCTWSSSQLTYDCSAGARNRATKAFYPDDPSNVYHSYMSDHTKFQILHAGVDLHHMHHQHAHQWLHSPDSPNGDYTDSQTFGPGSSFTLEMVYNGSGNVNQTVGDSIFHCHFYPHFAAGMWALWRVHDTFEPGTELDDKERPVTGAIPEVGRVTTARALPDGEIQAGTPIPALVPLPTLPMAPMPAKTLLVKGGTEVWACRTLPGGTTECKSNLLPGELGPGDESWKNPGYPFFIPGVGGQRVAHPPMDFAYACSDNGERCTPKYGNTPPDLSACGSPTAQCNPLDGGLPRHIILGGGTVDVAPLNPQDFSKTLEKVSAIKVAEDGTLIEKVAMRAHSLRYHPTRTPEGKPARFILNGLPPKQGAPYADPCIRYCPDGGVPPDLKTRRYKAADIQLDAIFNKEGWHLPQERLLTLWGDVKPTLNGTRPPEPFFFRADSGECIEYTQANLVPNVYELDDFEVRTPTDILGQHIHLVKFDVTSSDGATNGFNYEDGTFAPNEVVERIKAIRAGNGCTEGDKRDGTFDCPVAREIPFFGPGPGGEWVGAQATIQRWYADPLFDGPSPSPPPSCQPAPGARDRTLRTVFTHDHFGPSTHQQAGLYAGLVIEPKGSNWFSNENNKVTDTSSQLGGVDANGNPLVMRTVKGYNGVNGVVTVADGGPTSWQAVIETAKPAESFREFLMEMQDSTLAYNPFINLKTLPASGFCADDPKQSCTPPTDYDQPVKECKSGRCIAYGFCSTSLTTKCMPAPWATPQEINAQCGNANVMATCNLAPGIPGVCSSCKAVTAATPQVPVPQIWGTVPQDAPKGPEVITFSNASNNFSVNYRNEPLPQRLAANSKDPNSGDYSYAYVSIDRGDLRGYCSDTTAAACVNDSQCTSPATCVLGGFCSNNNAFCNATIPCKGAGVSCQGYPYPPLNVQPAQPGDPFTPIMRTYAGDDVQVRALVGAHTNPHNFTMQGLKWLFEASMTDSGWRNSMTVGISEHTEQIVRIPNWVSATTPVTPWADYLYMPGAAVPEQNGGNWGLIRAYSQPQTNLRSLPQNKPPVDTSIDVCGEIRPPHKLREYRVVAITAQQALSSKALVYNQLEGLSDPNGILFYNFDDLTCPNNRPGPSCTASSQTPQPLVLRASAGDCIQVRLYNVIDPKYLAAGTSTAVGLHPQLVTFDGSTSNGFNAGSNPIQTMKPMQPNDPPLTYRWYAGNVDAKLKPARHIPIEFGAANLVSSDVVNHFNHGLFGALVIEPEGADWPAGESSRITTVITAPASPGLPAQKFREFVLITRDLLSVQNGGVAQEINTANYGTEPLFNPNLGPGFNVRYCDNKCTIPSSGPTATDVGCVLVANKAVNLPYCCTAFDAKNKTCTACSACSIPPATPTFAACRGEQVRFRVLSAGGNSDTNQVFELYGHLWAETPYMSYGPGCVPPTTHTNLYSSSLLGDAHRCVPAVAEKLRQVASPEAIGRTAKRASLEAFSRQVDVGAVLELVEEAGAPLAEFGQELPDSLTDWQGSRMGHGPTNHYDVLIESAGGINKVHGDYLFRTYPSMHFRLGLWGIFSVLNSQEAAQQHLQCIK
ncbi:MAG: hypothetical protein WAM82_21050 [Thermoanaerobaculia bacterium]